MKKQIALALALLVGLAVALPAQVAPNPEPPKLEERFFQIKYLNAARIANLLEVFDVPIRRDDRLGILAVKAKPETLAAIADVLKRFDVPPPPVQNVELTFHILSASREKGASQVPADLEAVAKSIRSLFAFEQVRLLDSAMIRVRDGEGSQTGGSLKLSGEPASPAQYFLQLRGASVGGTDAQSSIRLDKLQLRFDVPVVARVTNKEGQVEEKIQYSRTEISTDIDVAEGQKVVVGKSSLASDAGTIVVVVTAKVVK